MYNLHAHSNTDTYSILILFFKKKKSLPLLDLHSIHLPSAYFLKKKKLTLASLLFFVFYLFLFFLFIIQLTKTKKRPLTLACSILFLFSMFSFY